MRMHTLCRKPGQPDLNEFFVVISGRVALTDAGGMVTKYCAGGCDIGPKGFDGKFKVLQTLRKVYITYNDL